MTDPITLPAEVVAQLERLAARGLFVEARTNGVDPQPGIGRLFAEVERARHATPTRPADPAQPAVVTVAEAARLMGCNVSWVRHLLGARRLRGRKAAGVWLVDLPLAISPVSNGKRPMIEA
jgi:hypothetical protein